LAGEFVIVVTVTLDDILVVVGGGSGCGGGGVKKECVDGFCFWDVGVRLPSGNGIAREVK